MELLFLLGSALVMLSLYLMLQLKSQGEQLQFENLILEMWKSELRLASETAKGLTRQLHSHLETVAAQEMEILKLSEKVSAQERELDSLRYKI
jgi:uncharacterized protein Yka (UPF0111/DUF47 family)